MHICKKRAFFCCISLKIARKTVTFAKTNTLCVIAQAFQGEDKGRTLCIASRAHCKPWDRTGRSAQVRRCTCAGSPVPWDRSLCTGAKTPSKIDPCRPSSPMEPDALHCKPGPLHRYADLPVQTVRSHGTGPSAQVRRCTTSKTLKNRDSHLVTPDNLKIAFDSIAHGQGRP